MRSLLLKTTFAGAAAAFAFASTTAGAVNHTVNVGINSTGAQDNAFTDTATNSNTTNASVGDTVTFNNVGASPGFHNVRSDGPVMTFRCANGCDGAGGNGNPSATNWTSTITLNTTGTINYYCEIHGLPGQAMFGTINVQVPVELQSFDVD